MTKIKLRKIKFKKMRPVTPKRLKDFRTKILKIDQQTLANYFEVNVKTIQRWEQGITVISGTSLKAVRTLIELPELIGEINEN